MPIATVQTPDGKTMTLEVPDGATQEQIVAFAEQNYKPTSAPADVPRGTNAPTPSFYDQLRESLMGGLMSAPRDAVGAAEVAGTFASGSVAEPVAGIA